MKKIHWLLSFGIVLAPQALFASTSYNIYIDAGSTGSRIHLFQSDTVANAVPVITDLFNESVSPGLSSFVTNPQNAGDSLKPLLDDVSSQLKQRGISAVVPVNVYATAGMRLLPIDQQTPIYADVTAFIKNNYSLIAPGDIKTITGKMEGLYAWLDVNYLAENFQNHQATVGSLDLGGASTQLALETNDTTKPLDETSLSINGQAYRVFSISFLGLGQDQARGAIGNYLSAPACYPHSYSMGGTTVGNYSFNSCRTNYESVLVKQGISRQLVNLADAKFIAFSGIYYTYKFFQPSLIADRKAYDTAISSVCAQSWEQLQKNYPSESVAYLSAYCANGAYVDDLLYQTYHLNDAQLTFSNKINGKSIDWALGAALYASLAS